MLEIDRLHTHYGPSHIVQGLDLVAAHGEVIGIFGRNGVGKTTLLKTIAGWIKPSAGEIRFAGRRIDGLSADQISRAGVGFVPEDRRIFPSLTVEENLTVAARPGRWELSSVYDLFPRLKERKGNFGNQLSGGEQQMLAVARALMTNPMLLLLDEPLEGLAPIIVEELAAALKNLSGIATILIEQHTGVALALTQDAVVIERGTIAHRAKSAEFARDAETLERYVGLKVS